MNEARKYVGLGLLLGVLGGIAEATLIHRLGLLFVPYAAVAYALMWGAVFVLLFLIARLVGRNLLPLGFAGAVFFFISLEAGFWLNRRTSSLVEALSSKMMNLAILALALLAAVLAALLLRSFLAKRSVLSAGAGATLVGVIILVVYFAGAHFSSAPGTNCILVSIDALRADHLGCYGYFRDTSPNIDKLAMRGMLFEKALTSSPGSTGGHGAMLTGLNPLSHGAYTNGMILDDANVTAAEVFKQNGYSTAAFTNNWYISPTVGFGQGFDCFVDDGNGHILRAAHPMVLSRGLALTQTLRRLFKKHGYPSDLEITDALRWIRWSRNRRFFLFLHVMDAHSPYIPPEEFRGRFGTAGADLDPKYIERLHTLEKDRYTAEQIEFLIDRYDEGILSADHKIGMLRAELERLGIFEDTMIVLLADHGEVMCEGRERYFGHGTLDYGCLEIPLVVSLPGRIPEGVRADIPVQTIDVLPTITDALRLKDTFPRQGISLVQESRDPATAQRPAFTLGDLDLGDHYSLVTEEWQFKIIGDQRYLYSLKGDMDTNPDVAESHVAVADSLESMLESWLQTSIDEAVVPFSLEERRVTPNRSTAQRLKALGYLQ